MVAKIEFVVFWVIVPGSVVVGYQNFDTDVTLHPCNCKYIISLHLSLNLDLKH
jgi:hypothetical protein